MRCFEQVNLAMKGESIVARIAAADAVLAHVSRTDDEPRQGRLVPVRIPSPVGPAFVEAKQEILEDGSCVLTITTPPDRTDYFANAVGFQLSLEVPKIGVY